MTTVHASFPPGTGEAPKGGKNPAVHLVMHTKDGQAIDLEASLSEILRAVRDSGGVGVFELLVADAQEYTVIVQSVEKQDQAITQMAVKEVTPEDFIRVDVELAAMNLPDAVLKREAEAIRLKKRIKVRAKIKDLPKRIVVDLSVLSPAQTLTAGDVSLPKGVELVTPKDAALFTVRKQAERV